jgi:hypothetical protein
MDNQQKPRTEEFNINGEELLTRLRELLQEGNIRRLSIRNEEGKTLVEVPLTTGSAIAVAAVILAPVWAALGALAALAAKLTVVVERVDAPTKPTTPTQPTDGTSGETKNLSQPQG